MGPSTDIISQVAASGDQKRKMWPVVSGVVLMRPGAA